MLNYTLMIGLWASKALLMKEIMPLRKSNLASIIGVIGLAAGVVIPISAQTQSDLKQIDDTLKQTQKVLTQSKNKRERSLLSIQSIEKQIAERTLRFDQTRTKVNGLDRQAGLLEAEIDRLEQEFDTAQNRLAQLIESAYLMGRQSGLKIALSQKGTQHMARLNHYAHSISDARQNQLDALQSLQQQLNLKNSALDNQRIQLEKLTAALEEDQRYLSQLKQNRLALVKQLDKTIAGSTQEIDHLRVRKAKLEQVLAEIAHRQKARAARKRVQEKRLQAVKNTPPKIIVSKPISRNGNLPMPARANIVSHFGDKREKSGLPWSGILMEGLEGSDIRAISAGEIVYADWLQGYGQMVIVDHGKGIMSLYGHNKRIHRTVGDHVKQSDIIASMGDTAGLKKPALYFEIRQDGVAQDPLKWCRS
jgi:septal ring factor EnvC (AmiA/AmiB activator)